MKVYHVSRGRSEGEACEGEMKDGVREVEEGKWEMEVEGEMHVRCRKERRMCAYYVPGLVHEH